MVGISGREEKLFAASTMSICSKWPINSVAEYIPGRVCRFFYWSNHSLIYKFFILIPRVNAIYNNIILIFFSNNRVSTCLSSANGWNLDTNLRTVAVIARRRTRTRRVRSSSSGWMPVSYTHLTLPTILRV